MVQRFAVSKLDSKCCVRYHFTLLPVVDLLKTARTAKLASLRGKKKKKILIQIFKMVFVANSEQCA